MTTNQDDSDDNDLFRKTIGTIKPLKNQARYLPKKPVSSGSPINTSTSTKPLEIPITESYSGELEELQELDASISPVFMRPGLQHRVMKQLRRGKIAQDDTLDLHGATAIQARKLLHEFITVCSANNYRAVIIVHGKGLRSTNNTPVLKTRVNYWLRDHQNVLGFCPAAPQHGGSGALYVLLKSGKNK
ncbi:MAG: Smr/MutS family protein [Methylococcales bacterium]